MGFSILYQLTYHLKPLKTKKVEREVVYRGVIPGYKDKGIGALPRGGRGSNLIQIGAIKFMGGPLY